MGGTAALQQGLDGYAGCIASTRWGADVTDRAGDPGHLHLRGAHNTFFVRFEIPARLTRERLARARLCLFLPEARKTNMFTEIFCHEVTAGGDPPTIDERTDYDNGRRSGAVDSVELFAPPHKYWNHFPYLPLGVPEGGRWIEFNVTSLAEKWIKDPEANRGVLLVPTSCPDRRFPSKWEIDVPSADFEGDTSLRPKLVLEFAPLKSEYLVGMTDGLRRICDRSTRYEYRGGYRTEHAMSMAADEFEGFQVVVYPMLEDLKNVRFTWTDLVGQGGHKIPTGDVEYFIEDHYRLRRNWKTRDVFFRGKLYETVDPLLPARPVTVKRHVHTPFLFRVRTRPGTKAGVYRGTITVEADNAGPARLSLRVKVWPYAIPREWNFHTMGQMIWGNVRRFHGRDFDEALEKKYVDFLLEHRFSPTQQYARVLSPDKWLAYSLERGMNTVYLSGNFTGSDNEMERLKRDYEKVKTLKALDCSLVYIGDETSKWDEMHRRANLVHAHLPGVLVMIGGSFPREELLDYIDVYDPQIGGKSAVFSLHEANADLIQQSQGRGEEFYWYVAAGPAYPYPNVQVEYPLVALRALFWMTYKYGVTGFEYYCYNIWERNYSDDPEQRYPNVKWKADGWSKGWPSNGDGMLFYPGPVSSLRFEAIRDGIEDWESLQVLSDCVDAVKGRKDASRHAALIERARRLLEVREDIVADFRTYTMDAERLLSEREELGELIAEFMGVIAKPLKWDPGAYTCERAAEVRRARRTALRRRMLRERHIAACERLGVEPLSKEAWADLWPRRVLFRQDFERAGDWDGSIRTDNVPPGSRRALAGQTKNRYYGRYIRVGIREDCARAATDTWVRFRYYLSGPSRLDVMLFDLTQGDNYAGRLERPEIDRWIEVTMKVTNEFRRKDGARASMAAGDAIDDVFFGAGRPGEDLQLLVDDVTILGTD